MQIISASNLEKTFTDNTNAIKKINFSIFSGKITGIVGPDGAGKTTILTKVKELIEDKYKKEVVVLRHRPSILPILSAIKHGKKEAEKNLKKLSDEIKDNEKVECCES